MVIFLQKVFSSAEENGLETVYRLNSVRFLKGFLFFSNKRSCSPKMKNISYGDLNHMVFEIKSGLYHLGNIYMLCDGLKRSLRIGKNLL